MKPHAKFWSILSFPRNSINYHNKIQRLLIRNASLDGNNEILQFEKRQSILKFILEIIRKIVGNWDCDIFAIDVLSPSISVDVT